MNLHRIVFLLIGPLLCSPGIAQDLDEAKAVHAKEVAEARETIMQSWQEVLTSAIKKNDQKAAGEYREWSEYFKNEGALYLTESNQEMGVVFKAYGEAIKSSGDKLRRAYLEEIERMQTDGKSDEVESLLAELAEQRLPAKLVSIQPHRTTNSLMHSDFRLNSVRIKKQTEKMNATFELTAGLSSVGLSSIRPCNFPSMYISHDAFRVILSSEKPDPTWKNHATWLQTKGLVNPESGVSFQAVTHPDRYIRVRANGEVWLDKFENTPQFRTEATFNIKPPQFHLWSNTEKPDNQ